MSTEPDTTDRWTVGDRVRVDIPDETHPDHRRYHGQHGTVIAIIPRRAPDGPAVEGGGRPSEGTPAATDESPRSIRGRRGSTTDPATCAYRVEFDGGGYGDVRFIDLRPPIVE